MEDAVEAAAVDDGRGGAGAGDDEIAGDVEVAGERGVLRGPWNRELVDARRHDDLVGAGACGARIDGDVEVRGADRLAERAGAVCVELVGGGRDGDRRSPRGTGERGAGEQGQHGPHGLQFAHDV